MHTIIMEQRHYTDNPELTPLTSCGVKRWKMSMSTQKLSHIEIDFTMFSVDQLRYITHEFCRPSSSVHSIVVLPVVVGVHPGYFLSRFTSNLTTSL